MHLTIKIKLRLTDKILEDLRNIKCASNEREITMIPILEQDVKNALETVCWGEGARMTYESMSELTPELKVFLLTYRSKRAHHRYSLFVRAHMFGWSDSIEMYTIIKTKDSQQNVNRSRNTTIVTDLLISAIAKQVRITYVISAYPDDYEVNRILKFLSSEESECFPLIQNRNSRRMEGLSEAGVELLKNLVQSLDREFKNY